MTDLLKINDVTFPTPEGSYIVTHTDVINEYESESGEKTVEIVRENVHSINVQYDGLLENKLHQLSAAIHPVNTVTFYDPVSGNSYTKKMKANKNRVQSTKKFYKHNLSAWSLSFSLEEM